MVERLQALKDMRQQEGNRLEAHHASGEPTVLPNVKSHITWLDKQIAKLQREINDHIDGHPELKQAAELIASIPGFGETTVAKVLAYAGDVRRFANAKALAAFIGVCPHQLQSGEFVQGAYDDLSNRSCRPAESLVHAGTGGAAPQPHPVSLWRKDEGERSGSESGGGGGYAQAHALDLRGDEIRKAV